MRAIHPSQRSCFANKGSALHRVVRDIERQNASFDLLSNILNILVHGTIPYERRSVCSTNNALAAALSQAAQPAEATMRRWKCGLIVDYLIAAGRDGLSHSACRPHQAHVYRGSCEI